MDTKSKLATMGLVGMLSEMKNPLTSIKLCIDMIEAGEEPKEDYFEMIKRNAMSLERNIAEMCNYFTEGGFSIQVASENRAMNDGMGE